MGGQLGPAFARSRPGGAGRLALGLLGALLVLLAASARASAAETVVGFDNLVPEVPVTSQYEAQGLKLGTAAELGGPALAHGDCGGPVVKEEPGETPPSSPNDAWLGACSGGGPSNYQGTAGALLKQPSGPMSLDVRNVAVGSKAIPVELIAFGPAGEQIGEATGEASPEEWTKLTVAPAGKIGFFQVRSTGSVAAGQIAIDNVAFQPPEEEKKGSEPPTPPQAVGEVVTSVPRPGQPIELSGAGSKPGSGGRIISYEWDFNNDGKIDTSTGTNPIAHVLLPPGIHTVGLTITNQEGQKSSSKFTIPLQTSITLPPEPDGGEGPCASSLEVVSADLLGECIQKKGEHEYVIQTKELGLNGMVLVPTEGGYGTYHVAIHRHLGIGTEYHLSGPAVRIELLNTPIGDMTLGGYDLSKEAILLGTAFEHIPVVKLASAKARAADEERLKNLKGSPLMSFGVGRSCKAGEKSVGCCPPKTLSSSCATLPGNFPLTGTIVIYLTSKGDALFDLQVGLNLKAVNFEATGELELTASRETGIELDTLRFGIPEAALKPIFKVKEASFVYYFPGNPDPERRDTWQAKATVTFGLLEEPGLEGELSFQHGQFHSAALAITLPPPGAPIYPGISLNKMGASVGVEPLTFGGLLGAKVAEVLQLELGFKFAEAEGEHLGFFGGKGVLKFGDTEIATLEGDVYSDGYSDAMLQLKIAVPFGDKEPLASAEGEIGYWDEAESGLWEAYGRVHIKIWEIDAEVAGLVNNKYIAGCGYIGPFGGAAAWSFESSSITVNTFLGGNCHDNLKPFKQAPLKQHTGGYVNETETESLRARPASARLLSPRRRPSSDATIAVASSPMGRDLRITSATGTPIVELVSPQGETFTTPSHPGQTSMSSTQFIAALGANPHEVVIYLSQPTGGEWHIRTAPGSAPLSKVEIADVAAPTSVHAKVQHHDKGFSLSYRASNLAPGMKIRFYERGRDSIHRIGTVTGASGKLSFAATEALGRKRKVYATILSSTGVPIQTLTVAAYTAPHAFRPGKARHIHFLRKGKTAVLSWGADPGAKLFEVKVKGSDGRIESFFAKPSRRSETLPNVLPFESFTATITAVGGKDMLPGRPTTAKLAPVKKKRASSHKHH